MIRPGRVDVIHEVGDATPHQMRTLYLNFFPDQPQLADAFADALSGSSVSMARRCSRTFARPRATLLLLAKAFLSSRRCCSRTCSSGATRRSRRARARQSWPPGWHRRGTRARCGRGRRRGRQRAGSAGPLRSCWGGMAMPVRPPPARGSRGRRARPRALRRLRAAGLFFASFKESPRRTPATRVADTSRDSRDSSQLIPHSVIRETRRVSRKVNSVEWGRRPEFTALRRWRRAPRSSWAAAGSTGPLRVLGSRDRPCPR